MSLASPVLFPGHTTATPYRSSQAVTSTSLLGCTAGITVINIQQPTHGPILWPPGGFLPIPAHLSNRVRNSPEEPTSDFSGIFMNDTPASTIASLNTQHTLKQDQAHLSTPRDLQVLGSAQLAAGSSPNHGSAPNSQLTSEAQPDHQHRHEVVVLKSVSKCYEKSSERVEALSDVSLSLKRGDRVVVTGTSGSGKSTLLHIIGTLDRPTSGQVLVEGHDVSTMSDHIVSVFRNSTVGFIFQMNNLLPELNALENVMVPGLVARGARSVVRSRAAELLRSVGLEHRIKHRPAELSGGEQQRVAIARALFMRPKILLADEPTGNLDAETSLRIQELIAEMVHSHHATLVLVTHDLSIAERFEQKVVMTDGRIQGTEGLS